MTRAVLRHGFAAVVTLLLAGIGLATAFLLVVVVPDVTRTAAVMTPAPSASPSEVPSASPLSPMALSPVGIEMAANADCAACHVTTTGTVGTRPIPRMAHPLWGWRDCTACHATGSLVETAPGHSGLHKADCLICHQPPESASPSAAPRPHHIYTDKPCLECHAKGGEAPLPTDMAGRTNCWVCHAGTEYEDLFAGNADDAGGADDAGNADDADGASPGASPTGD